MQTAEMKVREMVQNARPCTYIVYHTGNLMADRNIGNGFLAVHSVAALMWKLMLEGRVSLTQRRVSPHVCEYLAYVKPKPFQPAKRGEYFQ
jgi:hypothetical protein